jgi:hypothetical protein
MYRREASHVEHTVTMKQHQAGGMLREMFGAYR